MGNFLVDRLRRPWCLLNFIYHFTEASKKEKLTVKKLHQFTCQVIKEREEALKSETFSGRKMSRMLDLLLHEKLQTGGIDYEGIREEVDTFMFEVLFFPSILIETEQITGCRVMTLHPQL